MVYKLDMPGFHASPPGLRPGSGKRSVRLVAMAIGFQLVCQLGAFLISPGSDSAFAAEVDLGITVQKENSAPADIDSVADGGAGDLTNEEFSLELQPTNFGPVSAATGVVVTIFFTDDNLDARFRHKKGIQFNGHH